MNLFDLSPTEQPQGAIRTKQGGWVGTLPDGYTRMVDGKKFTVHTHPREGQLLIHKLPGGDIRIRRDGSISWYDDRGELHREDGPASIRSGSAQWYRHGEYHREDGPAVIYDSGAEVWYYDGKLHREDGPAITQSDGTEMWYRHGTAHREDGPAVTRADGSAEWYYRGEHHRKDGPAVVNADGTVEYWLHGKRVNEEDLP